VTKQEHLLTILAEECSEVIKEVSKCLRFGMEDKGVRMEYTNGERLHTELVDLVSTIKLLHQEKVLKYRPTSFQKKIERTERYIQYAIEKGTIT
jgi:hypothetical protein